MPGRSPPVRLVCRRLASCLRSLALPVLVPVAAAAGPAPPVRVVATTPDVAFAVRGVGDGRVEVATLLPGTGDPHLALAVPEFVRLVAAAQVVCAVGLGLEAGYLPQVLERAGNAAVGLGGRGACELGKAVPVLDKPFASAERQPGDVHPFGNPHYWLSPQALGEGAAEISAVLGRVDPAHAAEYAAGLARFRAAMAALSREVAATLAPVKRLQDRGGRPLIMEYHREFIYFLDQFGLTSRGSLEDMPGSLPAARRLAEAARSAKAAGVRVLVAAEYDPPKTLARFTELSGIPVVVVPTMSRPGSGGPAYPALQRRLAAAIAAAVTGK